MLQSVKELEKYTIGATDGTIGSVIDLLFDDKAWVIRYLVVNTSTWLVGRKVLISPFSIYQSDQAPRVFRVSISKEQIRNSPSIDTDKTVSRQHEAAYLSYYAYPHYWGGSGFWGDNLDPRMMVSGSAQRGADTKSVRARAASVVAEKNRRPDENLHLRSCSMVNQYHVHASDGDMGHVDGFLVEEHSWAIRYLIVNTSNWWFGHHVLLSPDWIEEVSWPDAKVWASLRRQAIKDAPTYDSDRPLDRSMEARIYSHYGHPGYWLEKRERAAVSEIS